MNIFPSKCIDICNVFTDLILTKTYLQLGVLQHSYHSIYQSLCGTTRGDRKEYGKICENLNLKKNIRRYLGINLVRGNWHSEDK